VTPHRRALGELSSPKMKQAADWNDFRAISFEPAADLQFGEAELWNPVSLAAASSGCQIIRVRAASCMDFDQAFV